ncbi:MAG: ribonuclease III [Gammaproteobacteria bacterium]|nr:ribonuclease III [Gammaproteobacteria bacterium]
MKKNSLSVNKLYLELPLFKQALIHKSYSSSHNNERLEFLGDSVLEIFISEYLFNRFDDLNEGRLTQMRASLVNTQTLAGIFMQLNCKDLLQTSKGTNKLDETHKYSIYAGALEACIGAIFLELGFNETKKFLSDLFSQNFSELNESIELKDSKSRLQEVLQSIGAKPLKYSVVSNKEGNNYDCTVIFNNETFHASSPIKKESEQKVANLILEKLNQ